MHIVTNGRNIELTDAIKDYVHSKLSRLQNHYDFIQEVHVILEVMKNPRIAENQLAEATVHVPGLLIRVEAASESLYASIDMLVDKIERSLKKHKTKLLNRSTSSHDTIRHGGELSDDGTDDEDDLDAELEADFQAQFVTTED